MNDTDIELERRLRAHFRDERATDTAPLALRAGVLAIPRTAGRTAASGWARRRGLTLLAAMVALGIGAAGWAMLAGSRSPDEPKPSQPAMVVVPSTSPSPSASSLPSIAAPSSQPASPSNGPGPIVDVTAPGISSGWQPAGTMAQARILPTATLLHDGRVLVVGGISSDKTPITSAEIWDSATGTFSAAGSLAQPRIGHASTLLHDGRVLIVGGEDGLKTGTEYETEVWDPATGRFESVGSMPPLPSGLTATTLLDGRVLIVGSDVCLVAKAVNANNPLHRCPGASAATWLWNPDGTYTLGPPLNEPRSWHTATLLPDGRVLLVGNRNWSADDPESSEVYDPATNTFVRVGEPRDLVQGAQSATLLGDGRVLITGGDTSEPNGDPHYFGPLKTAETWDPASGGFLRAGRMDVARRAHQAAVLPDGRVIVVGGSGVMTNQFIDPSTATTEVWDPATNSFRAGPEMADKRAQFTLTTLLDGSLLVIGGDAHYDARHDQSRALATAEILDFTPSP